MGITQKQYAYDAAAGNPYVDDFGANRNFVGRLGLSTSGLDDATADAIIGAVGATAIPLGTKVPCSDSASKSFNPRYLEFSFNDINGNSRKLKIAVGDRTNVVAAAQAVYDLLAGLAPGGAGALVGCVKLIGEQQLSVYERFAPIAGKTVAVAPQFNLGTKYKASYTYTADVQNGQVITRTMALATDVADTAPSALSGPIAAAAVILTGLGVCGGERKIRDVRRFVADTIYTDAVTGDNKTQKTIIPVSSNASADIVTAGNNIAAVTSVVCMHYYGESFSRVTRFLT